MVKDEFSPFKRHSGWFSQRAAGSGLDAHPGAIEQHWASMKDKVWDESMLKWECLGPFNISGRMTSLTVHPADPLRLYAGAAAGGVWTSGDGGATWQTNWPIWFSQNIGVLAFDAADPKTIYVGSGEANISPDCYPGSGLYVSRDGGATWVVLADAEEHALPKRIGAFACSPTTPGLLFLGGVNLDENQPGGLYRSIDGGANWIREDGPSCSNYWCHSIVVHPDGTAFAALEMRGWQSGVYRCDAGGSTWKQLHGGLPDGDQVGRISLALAPSAPDMIYALISDPMGKHVLGVYRSRKRGERWTEIGGDAFRPEDQGCYNNAIAVHPARPEVVVCGLNDLRITVDGGENWTRASHWDADEGDPVYVHGDQHVIVMPAGDLIYVANDGGVVSSSDLGASWTDRGKGLVTTMFYDIDVSPVNSKLLGGGAQDNGSLVAGVTERDGDFLRVLDGDGAWMVFDTDEETHVYGSKSDLHIFRHTASKRWGSDFWQEVSPKKLKEFEHHQVAIAVLAIAPDNGHKVWAGSRRLWMTDDDGNEWEARSPEFDGTAITAIEIPTAAPNQVFVGTKRGGIFRSLDGGANWSGDLSGPEIPSRVVTRIETHPRKASRVVATIGGTGSISRRVPRVRAYSAEQISSGEERLPHVFLSDDGGLTWRVIDGPELPAVAFHAAVFETHEPYRLFVANDCGVWMTEAPEAETPVWKDVSMTLPNAMISDLVYHHRDRMLTAATYGRGIWRAAVARAVDATNAEANR